MEYLYGDNKAHLFNPYSLHLNRNHDAYRIINMNVRIGSLAIVDLQIISVHFTSRLSIWLVILLRFYCLNLQ